MSKELSSYDEIQQNMSRARDNARGPDKYVIEAQQYQVNALERLELEIYSFRRSINSFNKKASDETQRLINLTKAIAVLTVLMLVGVLVQVYILLQQR